MSSTPTWTTVDVVRMTGVTSRTLRHYDAMGLVTPIGTSAGGMRVYGRVELLRLQHVLLLRELGLSLPAIKAVADGTTDRVAALRDHRTRLELERERLGRVLRTVDRTIDELEGAGPMSAEQMFEGFEPERQKAYERELVADWGVSEDAIDRSAAAVKGMGAHGVAAQEAERAEIEARLVALMAAGVSPDGQSVLDELAAHWELTGRYWGQAPSAEAYSGLGEMYVQHPDFRTRYDGLAPGFAQWMSDAMTAYSLDRLT